MPFIMIIKKKKRNKEIKKKVRWIKYFLKIFKKKNVNKMKYNNHSPYNNNNYNNNNNRIYNNNSN